MRKFCTFVGCCLVAAGLTSAASGQTLITFETRAEPASVAGVVVDPNISGGTLSRGPGIVLNSGSTYNSASFTVGAATLDAAIAAGDYVSFTIDAASGFQASISQIQIRYDRSNTGPNQLAILSSVTGFTAAATPVFTDISVSASGEPADILVSGHGGLSGTIEFRIYAWGATADAGTFDIEVYPSTGGGPGIGIIVNGSTASGGGLTGACCVAGACTQVEQANCTGVFQGVGVTCSPNPCPEPMGACCVNGICVGDLTQASCLANGAGSVWGGEGTACATFACPEPTGSCCVGVACTANVTAATCGAMGGVITINGACTPNLCDDGSCCNPTYGSCRLAFTEADCNAVGGLFTLGGLCTPNPCIQPSSACCLPGGNCVTNLTGLDCRAQGGVYLGVATTCAPAVCDRATGTNLVAKYDFDVNVLGGGSRNLTFVTSVSSSFATDDQFGVAQRYVDDNLPIRLLDDTVFAFPTDTQGIITESKVDSWFGVIDLYDVILPNPTDTATATWTFDIAGFTGLSLTIDMAAMGDFETAAGCSLPPCIDDRYEFAVSIDGSTPVPVFTAIADEAGSQTYTMASGVVTNPINDPLVVNGTTVLNNLFQSLTANLTGAGNVLTLTLTASGDGADEAVAFDNIMVMGTANVVEGACCLTGGACTSAAASLCAVLNGVYQGDGSVCTPELCLSPATGACCAGSTCSVTTLAACADPGMHFAGAGTVCNVPGNNTAPCCKADYNQSGTVTVQDIFDFLSGYFSQNARADVNASGTITVQDIFDFLGAYFAGCH